MGVVFRIHSIIKGNHQYKLASLNLFQKIVEGKVIKSAKIKVINRLVKMIHEYLQNLQNRSKQDGDECKMNKNNQLKFTHQLLENFCQHRDRRIIEINGDNIGLNSDLDRELFQNGHEKLSFL